MKQIISAAKSIKREIDLKNSKNIPNYAVSVPQESQINFETVLNFIEQEQFDSSREENLN